MVKHGWFQLEELIQSVLADVISADANFQLSQTAAWRDFSESVQAFADHSNTQQFDVSEGLGRLQNLGVSTMTVRLPVEAYRPNVVKRFWMFLKSLFEKPSGIEQKYRLASGNHGAVIELEITVSRDERGRWSASSIENEKD